MKKSNPKWQEISIEVAKGDQVQEEDTLMILESMKMEIPVLSPAYGTVKEILVQADEKIEEW